MNEVIMGLYEIEEQAGKITEESSLRRQEISEEYQRQKEQAEAELKAELEKVAQRIDQMLSGGFRRQGLPQ